MGAFELYVAWEHLSIMLHGSISALGCMGAFEHYVAWEHLSVYIKGLGVKLAML